MQETFDSKSVSPPGMKDDERREILAHLEKIMPQHTGKQAGANDSFSRKDHKTWKTWPSGSAFGGHVTPHSGLDPVLDLHMRDCPCQLLCDDH